MTGVWFATVGYSVVAALFAVVAWGILWRRMARGRRPAATIAVLIWLLAVVPPLLGLYADSRRGSLTCEAGQECYRYILWYLGFPVGWMLAALVFGAVIAWGGRNANNRRGDQHSL